jgi:leader peptidase (prepilin peptidase)/N-methyltransferase
MSIVTPRSKCPSCAHLIKWYQNIPVFSYLIQRGKCSKCDFKIPLSYVLVEMMMGIFSYLLIPNIIDLNNIILYFFYFSTAAVFVSHFLIDVEHQILPDKINLYLLMTVVPFVVLNRDVNFWAFGGVIGFGLPYLVTYAFYKLRGVIGLGGGDIKLFGILGLLLGPIGIVQNMFFSCALGSLVGVTLILLKKMNKDKPMAFGPYIIVSAAIQIYLPGLFNQLNPFLR